MVNRVEYLRSEYGRARRLTWVFIGLMAALAGVGLIASFLALPSGLERWGDLLFVPAMVVVGVGAWNWLLALHLLLVDRRIEATARRRWILALIGLNVYGAAWFVLANSKSYR